MKSAKDIFREHLRNNGLLCSKQRERILDIFLKTEKHLTVEDLHERVRKKYPKIGLATVYRAMKVICDAGLARETNFGDGIRRFEHEYLHKHHHHLVCLKCGRVVEVISLEIEKAQQKAARKHHFTIVKDTMKIFGLCKNCKSKEIQG